jgi:HK97 family phage prohead protease
MSSGLPLKADIARAPPYAIKVSDDGTVLSIKMILPGAFSDAQKRRAEFWIAHDPSRVVGSTDNGLELHSDERGLAFRFRFPNTALGNEAKWLVADKEYMALVVSFSIALKLNSDGTTIQAIDDFSLQGASSFESNAAG